MNNFENIIYSVTDQVAEIRLNRPQQANSMNVAILKEMQQAISLANGNSDVRVVILSSEGRLFCAGADLKDTEMMKKGTEKHLMEDHFPVLNAIKNSNKPFIASVQGGAAGIGTAYVMICDLAIMSTESYIYQAFTPIGLIPDGGASWMLHKQIGFKKAFELIALAEKLPAQQCVDLGLANKVVDTEDLQSETMQWAINLANKAPLSLSNAKRLLHSTDTNGYEEQFEMEAKIQDKLQVSDDAKEGVMAFLEKRKPVFKGE